jgi:hypothetical protein
MMEIEAGKPGRKHVYADKDNELWLDPGNGELVALDGPILRRIMEKWPQQPKDRVEAEFGPLRELIDLSGLPGEILRDALLQLAARSDVEAENELVDRKLWFLYQAGTAQARAAEARRLAALIPA